MAIYHLHLSSVSRGQGRNVIASAAYISGSRLVDRGRDEPASAIGHAAHHTGTRLEEAGGRAIDYTAKPFVEHAEIALPHGAAPWMGDRQSLWQGVEAKERRKDAQLAKGLIVALPRELSLAENIELMRGFVADHLVAQGLVVDWAIHVSPDRDGLEQPHAHALTTTRRISAEGFHEKIRGLDRLPFLHATRQAWADHCNRALAQAGRRERIDHRSHADRGIDLTPQIKLGAAACRRAAAGLASERHAHNLAVRQRNGDRLLARPELAMAALQSERVGEITRDDLVALARRHSIDLAQRDRVQAALSGWLDRVQAMTKTARQVMVRLRDRSLAASTSALDRTAELARQVATRMAQERDKRRAQDRGR